MDPDNTLPFVGLIASCFHGLGAGRGLAGSLFLAGVFGGFSHCISMCGPFVVSQAGQFSKISDSLLLPYHLGRLTTYALLGLALGSVFNLAFLFLPMRAYVVAPILFLAGCVFLANAMPFFARVFPWTQRLYFRWPAAVTQNSAIHGMMSAGGRLPGVLRSYVLGVMLGFVPCGMIVAALMAAATAPTPLQSAMAMAAFGAGTLPALWIFAWGGQELRARAPALFGRITQGLMVWSGLWLFALAGMMLF